MTVFASFSDFALRDCIQCAKQEDCEASFSLFGLHVYRREMEMPLETKRISVCLILFVLNLAAAIEIPLTGKL